MLAQQRLDELDRSSIGFPEQFDRLLHDKQWEESLKRLPEDELGELISHLNNVRSSLTPTKTPLIAPRFSII